MALIQHEIKNIYIGEFGWHPGANTIAYYTFDSQTLYNTATQSIDSTWYSGNGSYTTGYKGEGYCVDISVGGPIALGPKIPQGNFTFFACIKFKSYPPSSGNIWGLFGNILTGGDKIHCQFNGTNILQYYYYDGSSGYSQSLSTGTLAADIWYRLYLVRNNGNLTLYINGTSTGGGSCSTTNTQDDTYYLGGAYDMSSRKLYGYMDNVIIEDKAWTQDEITAYDNLIK